MGSSQIKSVDCSPTGNFIVSGSDDKTVKIWKLYNWDDKYEPPIKTFKGHTATVNSVSYSPNGEYVASGSDDGSIKIWHIKTGKAITINTEGKVSSIVYSPNGQFLAGAIGHTIIISELKDNFPTNKRIVLIRHTDTINCIAYSLNGKFLASGSRDQLIKIWNTATNECVHTLDDISGSVNAIAYSPNGKFLASGSDNGAIKIWDVESGTCLHTLKQHTKPITCVAYHPDGKFLISGSEDIIMRWKTQTGQSQNGLVEGNWQRHYIPRSIKYHPSGEYIMIGGKNIFMTISQYLIGADYDD